MPSSRVERWASASVERVARETRINEVTEVPLNASNAWRQVWRCFSKPDMGPRQDASPTPLSMNDDQSPGSERSHSVCAVGAVSKTMRS